MSVTRREAIRRGVLLSASLALRRGASGQPPSAPLGGVPRAADRVRVSFSLNGKHEDREIEARTTLLDLLRETIGLTGAKMGCDHGQCGACTVLIDGQRMLSCLTLAATVDGRSVTTIEGLANGERLHPLQEAFLAHDGFQCGYCTPGQIMSAAGFLREPWGEGKDAIREGMSGNLCRCGAYCGIVAAIEEARRLRA